MKLPIVSHLFQHRMPIIQGMGLTDLQFQKLTVAFTDQYQNQ